MNEMKEIIKLIEVNVMVLYLRLQGFLHTYAFEHDTNNTATQTAIIILIVTVKFILLKLANLPIWLYKGKILNNWNSLGICTNRYFIYFIIITKLFEQSSLLTQNWTTFSKVNGLPHNHSTEKQLFSFIPLKFQFQCKTSSDY